MEVSAKTVPLRKPRKFVSDEYFELKTRIHDRLLDLIDLSLLESLDPDLLKSQIRALVDKVLQEEDQQFPLNAAEREQLFAEIEDEVMGLGPLEPFLQILIQGIIKTIIRTIF